MPEHSGLADHIQPVDKIISSVTNGKTSADLPPFNYEDHWNVGAEPHEAASDSLCAAGVKHKAIEF